jgi:histidyl-tRNA synthetase
MFKKGKKMTKIQSVRGTYDLYGVAKRKAKKVISTASAVVEKYGFEEIETPVFEFTDVFSRNLGDTSDIVTKEMYCFTDRSGESLTLRPEGTAGVVRSFISEGMQQNLPVKLYYAGPMFRYERPQKGRQRQFTQFGVEMLGVATPQADIEVIAMAYEFLEKLGLNGAVTVEINSLGDTESRNAYRAKLVAYLKEHYENLADWKKIRCEFWIRKKNVIAKSLPVRRSIRIV